jgi:hypothetical protein
VWIETSSFFCLTQKAGRKRGEGGQQLTVVYHLSAGNCQSCVTFRRQLFAKFHLQKMKEKKDVSFEEKLHILSLAEVCVKNSDIAKKLGQNIRTIQRIIKAQKRLPPNTPPPKTPPPPSVKRSGRGRKVTDRMMERLILFVSRNPFKTG